MSSDVDVSFVCYVHLKEPDEVLLLPFLDSYRVAQATGKHGIVLTHISEPGANASQITNYLPNGAFNPLDGGGGQQGFFRQSTPIGLGSGINSSETRGHAKTKCHFDGVHSLSPTYFPWPLIPSIWPSEHFFHGLSL